MVSVEIEIDGDGIRELLGRDDVQQMLMTKAKAVAAAVESAGVMVEDGTVPLPVEVVDGGTPARARAVIAVDHPAALAVEAKYRVLGSALDAAR